MESENPITFKAMHGISTLKVLVIAYYRNCYYFCAIADDFHMCLIVAQLSLFAPVTLLFCIASDT